ncbi:MAG: cyclase family protein [Crocinitomicaceae bacterium]
MKLYISSHQWFDTNKGIDISLPLSSNKGATAWYVDPVKIWPVTGEGFIGKVSEGGSTNFNNIQLNPHGNGTHTETVGHISEAFYSINENLKTFFFTAELVTITPVVFFNKGWKENDRIIDLALIQAATENIEKIEALIIRTEPNDLSKMNLNYSNTNPPYISEDAMAYIVSLGVQHLLIDLPSVDRENDHGELLAHKCFWDYPNNIQAHKTISELIYVPTNIIDGTYILNIQIISLENDASPSKPILYPIQT